MAIATAPAHPAAKGLRTTITLAAPIEVEGRMLTELSVIEPELRHHIAADRNASMAEGSILLLASLTGLPEEHARKLKTRDARQVLDWMRTTTKPVPGADPEAVELQAPATFDLVVPIEIPNGKPITRLTLREPDLEVGVVIEKFRGHHEQIAAMIATLSGHTIPVISRLVMRDVVRIEAWLGPFVGPTTSVTGNGET